MDEKQVNLIRKALHDTAGQLKPGEGSGKAVRNSVLSLIRTEAQSRQALSSMSEAELTELLKYNRRLVDIANRFLGEVMELPLTPEQAEQADQLQQRIQSAQADLDAGRSELARLNRDLAKASAECAVQNAAIEATGKQVQEKKDAYELLKQTETALQDQLAAYSDEVIQAQDEKNSELARTIASQQGRLRELEGQFRVLDGQRAEEQKKITAQQEKLEALQKQVDAQPEELRALEEDYTALDAKLARIQTAAEECSEEKQAELREQIDGLEPVVAALVEKHGELTAALKALNESRESELAETAAAEEELLASMNAAVDALQEHCESLAEKLRTAMARSEQFEESLKLCRDNYDRYHNWFRSDAPVLTAMCERAGLSEKEYQTLYETLDPARCDLIRTLMTETEEHLRQLDQILNGAVSAAQQDQDDTRYRAEVGEPPERRN